jgi:hypothetical protein
MATPPTPRPATNTLHYRIASIDDTHLNGGCLHDSIGVIFSGFIISAGKSWGSYLQTKWSSIIMYPEQRIKTCILRVNISKNVSALRWSSSTSSSAFSRGEVKFSWNCAKGHRNGLK